MAFIASSTVNPRRINARQPRPRFWAYLLAIGVLFTGSASWSQQPPEERWFQIEVVIFSQGNVAVSGLEQWRAEMDRPLRYPSNWVELISPNQEPEPATGAVEEATDVADGIGIPGSPEDVSRQINLLAPENHELAAEAGQLARSNQYRVLFHGAWRQALVEQDQAPAILIQGGEQYGDHFELEGTINVSVARYLHLTTDLWLTQFATNYGQQRQDWPDLPRRPNQGFDPSSSPFLKNDGWNQLQMPSANSVLGEYNSILSRPYIIENIAVMRETRKMYSKELHYLDHPLLGLMVKIIPYQAPVLEPSATGN